MVAAAVTQDRRVGDRQHDPGFHVSTLEDDVLVGVKVLPELAHRPPLARCLPPAVEQHAEADHAVDVGVGNDQVVVVAEERSGYVVVGAEHHDPARRSRVALDAVEAAVGALDEVEPCLSGKPLRCNKFGYPVEDRLVFDRGERQARAAPDRIADGIRGVRVDLAVAADGVGAVPLALHPLLGQPRIRRIVFDPIEVLAGGDLVYFLRPARVALLERERNVEVEGCGVVGSFDDGELQCRNAQGDQLALKVVLVVQLVLGVEIGQEHFALRGEQSHHHRQDVGFLMDGNDHVDLLVDNDASEFAAVVAGLELRCRHLVKCVDRVGEAADTDRNAVDDGHPMTCR